VDFAVAPKCVVAAAVLSLFRAQVALGPRRRAEETAQTRKTAVIAAAAAGSAVAGSRCRARPGLAVRVLRRVALMAGAVMAGTVVAGTAVRARCASLRGVPGHEDRLLQEQPLR